MSDTMRVSLIKVEINNGTWDNFKANLSDYLYEKHTNLDTNSKVNEAHFLNIMHKYLNDVEDKLSGFVTNDYELYVQHKTVFKRDEHGCVYEDFDYYDCSVNKHNLFDLFKILDPPVEIKSVLSKKEALTAY